LRGGVRCIAGGVAICGIPGAYGRAVGWEGSGGLVRRRVVGGGVRRGLWLRRW